MRSKLRPDGDIGCSGVRGVLPGFNYWRYGILSWATGHEDTLPPGDPSAGGVASPDEMTTVFMDRAEQDLPVGCDLGVWVPSARRTWMTLAGKSWKTNFMRMPVR